jgi:hypothetical protein
LLLLYLPALVRQFREALSEAREAPRARARVAYEKCLSLAATFAVSGEHPAACAVGLSRLAAPP